MNGNHYGITSIAPEEFLLNGKTKVKGFSTDIADSLVDGESWNAPVTDIGNSRNELASTWYEKKMKQNEENINAIDYITSNYLNSPENSAAQVAIWDLSLNGEVIKNRYGYHWSNMFAEYGVNMISVYKIEQSGLGNDTKSWGSLFADSGKLSCDRPQDIAFAPNAIISGPPPVPEASSVFSMTGLLVAGGISIFKRRK